MAGGNPCNALPGCRESNPQFGDIMKHVLSRSSDAPIEFEGTLIGNAKSPAHARHVANPTNKAHWWEADSYQTDSGVLVVHVKYRWAGKLWREVSQQFVFYGNPDTVMSGLREFNAAACVGGFPSGSAYEEKQAQLLRMVSDDYQTLVKAVECQIGNTAKPLVIA